MNPDLSKSVFFHQYLDPIMKEVQIKVLWSDGSGLRCCCVYTRRYRMARLNRAAVGRRSQKPQGQALMVPACAETFYFASVSIFKIVARSAPGFWVKMAATRRAV